MKKQTTLKSILGLIVLSFSFSMNAQEYCNYTEQIAADFNGGTDEPYEILEQQDGKILTIGTSYYSSSNSYKASVARMDSNLQALDDTFGNNGKVTHTWDSRNTCYAAALQDDGKILIGGYQAPGNGVSTFRPYVARLLDDGSPDESWGELGSARFGSVNDSTGGAQVVGVKQFDNGSVRAAITGLSSNAGHGVVQFDSFGVLDTTFSDNGIAFYGVADVSAQTDYGKGLFMDDGSTIIVSKAFNGYTRPCVTKLNNMGDLDTNFATNGTQYIDYPIKFNFAGIHAALDENEDIIIAATSQDSPHNIVVFKLNGETGELDSSFDLDGRSESSYSSNMVAAHGLVIHPETGEITVLATGSEFAQKNAIWRISANGTEIPGCDGDAFDLSLDVPYNYGFYKALFASDGDIVIVGRGSTTLDVTNEMSQGVNMILPRAHYFVGVEENENISFQVSPNPANSFINIQVENGLEIDKVRIYNNVGQIVLETFDFHSSVNISSLSDGLYIVEMTSGKTVLKEKLIKR